MSKTITITGASSEIGMAILGKISNKDDFFFLHTASRIKEMTEFVWPLNIKHKILEADFSKSDELASFCSEIRETDVLINLAGETKTDILPMISDNDIKKMMEVNVYGLIKTCQTIIPYMSSKRKGCIVNISSIAASRGNRGQTVYAGTKGFAESFSRSLAAEWGSRGIRVNCIAPGAIDAGNLKKFLIYAPDEIKNNMLSKRLGKPSDIASLVAFLISEESEFINGQVVTADGGFMKGL